MLYSKQLFVDKLSKIRKDARLPTVENFNIFSVEVGSRLYIEIEVGSRKNFLSSKVDSNWDFWSRNWESKIKFSNQNLQKLFVWFYFCTKNLTFQQSKSGVENLFLQSKSGVENFSSNSRNRESVLKNSLNSTSMTKIVAPSLFN